MKLIVGLGNPGNQYVLTRHNAGFLAVDFFLEQFTEESGALASGWNFDKKNHADVTKIGSGANMLILAKPQTFMNNSGDSVQALLHFYKISLEDLLVLYDEIDLPLGSVRFRENGSSAGHNGMQSIIDKLSTQDIKRIRIGINQENRSVPTDAFVLQRFTESEQEQLKTVFKAASQAIKTKFLKKKS